jgi:hypothetical protein
VWVSRNAESRTVAEDNEGLWLAPEPRLYS